MASIREVDFSREGRKSVAEMLRRTADRLDAGELGDVQNCAMALHDVEGKVNAFGFGPRSDDLSLLALLRRAEHKLLNALDGD